MALVQMPILLEVTGFDDDFYLYTLKLDSSGSNGSSIKLWEHYEILPSMPRKTLPFGSWTKGSGLEHSALGKWDRRHNLEGAEFRVQSLTELPYMELARNENGDLYMIKGIIADIWLTLQNKLNFTYTLNEPADLKFGSLDSDGNWNGLIRDLIDDKADMAVTSLSMTYERSNAITFPRYIDIGKKTLFIKNPTNSYNYKAYFEPLHQVSWLSIGIFSFLMPFILYLPFFVYLKCFNNCNEEADVLREFTLGKCAILVLSSLTVRGWNVTPNWPSSQAVFLTIMTGSYLLFIHWEAMLITYLTVQKTPFPFIDIAGLLDQTNFIIAILPGSALEDAFVQSNDPIKLRAWEERIEPNLDMMRPGNTPYVEHMLNLILNNSEVAAYGGEAILGNTPEYITCQIQDIPARFDPFTIGIAFQRDSQYVQLFDHFLNIMYQEGISNNIFAKHESAGQVCPDSSGSPIAFNSCITAFTVLLIGFIASLVLYIIEMINYQRTQEDFFGYQFEGPIHPLVRLKALE